MKNDGMYSIRSLNTTLKHNIVNREHACSMFLSKYKLL